MQRVDRDLGTRMAHWSNVIELGNQVPGGAFFGQGAGTFPALYQRYFPTMVGWIGSAAVDPRYGILRLAGAGDMLFAQRLELEGTELRLEFAVRALEGGRLSVSLCSRNILDLGWWDGRCDTQFVELSPSSSFETHTLVLALPIEARTGEAADWPRALHFRTLKEGRPIEINGVRDLSGLTTPIRNGSFKQGMDYWFFSTDFGHLPFHIKNTWLQFWFDHGWLGLLLMLAMVALVARRALAAPPGQCFTPMAATAVLGLGALGMFGTPLDEARVSWLFYLLLFAGVLEPSRRAAPMTFSAPLAFRMAR
jgi:hypothetical protein